MYRLQFNKSYIYIYAYIHSSTPYKYNEQFKNIALHLRLQSGE